MSKLDFVRRIGKAIFGNGNGKPGESPFCKKVLQDNKDAHERIERYIDAVDKRSEKADEKIDTNIESLKKDMNSGMDRIVAILKPN